MPPPDNDDIAVDPGPSDDAGDSANDGVESAVEQVCPPPT